ncbi:BQ5605_C008g05164 [Microbotryum silenes-dioicae]|uniref:BQ5605_C008g05164 protein n=1 Tax=Microbotryum silenes-dioicae TaxID=796604 RepID=A0A2X0P7W6_9BASI|nr:BQ5605_C008g05164 [Microbotryum silenes-dioicae]
MSPATRIDHLPVELLRVILSTLRDSGAYQSSLKQGSLVNSRWRAVAQPLLMQDIHIDSGVAARRLIKSGMLERHRHCTVRSFRLGSLNGCKTWVNYIRIILIEMMHSLSHLELVGIHGIDPGWFESASFQSLRSLRLSSCTFDGELESSTGRLPPAVDLPNLESLTVEQENDWAYVLPPCKAPRLESLALIHTRPNAFSKDEVLDRESDVALIQTMPELIVIKLVLDYRWHLTKLSIEIDLAICIIEPIIATITRHCEHLKDLHLHLHDSLFAPHSRVRFHKELLQRIVATIHQSKLQLETLCLTGWDEGSLPSISINT